MKKHKLILNTFLAVAAILFSCTKSSSGGGTANPPPPVGTNDVDFWLTKNDQSVLLQKQSTVLSFGTAANSYANIIVDTTQTYQTIDGFGFTLTGGSAFVIDELNATDKANLL